MSLDLTPAQRAALRALLPDDCEDADELLDSLTTFSLPEPPRYLRFDATVLLELFGSYGLTREEAESFEQLQDEWIAEQKALRDEEERPARERQRQYWRDWYDRQDPGEVRAAAARRKREQRSRERNARGDEGAGRGEAG